MKLLFDENLPRSLVPGEVKPLSAYGIVAVSTKWQTQLEHPDKIAFSPTGVTFQDGTTRPTFDLILKAKPIPALASVSLNR